MNEELVEALHPIAYEMMRQLDGRMRDSGWWWDKWRNWETSGNKGTFSTYGWNGAKISFWNGPDARVDFFNFRPRSSDTKCERKPPVVLKSEVKNSILTKLQNYSSIPITRKRSITESVSHTTEKSLAQEMAVKAALEFQTKIGVESGIISAETGLTVSFEAAYSRAWSRSESVTISSSDDGNYEFVLAPKTEINIERVISRAMVRREAVFTGGVDFSISIWSHPHFFIDFPSRSALASCMLGNAAGILSINGKKRGDGGDKAEDAEKLENAFRKGPFPKSIVERVCDAPVMVPVTVTDERFEDALEYVITEKSLAPAE